MKQIKILSIFLLVLVCYFVVSLTGVLAADTSPPQLEISTSEGHFKNHTIILHGRVTDESGVQSVTINGEEATGTFTNIHFFWYSIAYTLSLKDSGAYRLRRSMIHYREHVEF